MTKPKLYERSEVVWQAVAELERRFYTRSEIADALREIADEVDDAARR
jgi:hypothetical protein